MNITKYKTLIFDCDGVILNSNKIKTQAFYQAALPYGVEAATKLMEYHKSNGGISRYEKFKYFLGSITNYTLDGKGLEYLLDKYALEVRSGLSSCQIVSNLESVRRHYSNAKWMVVSGGNQDEIREIFGEKGILNYFDGGVFGSPDTKDDIFHREIETGRIVEPALYLGDSKYDYLAASRAGFDFIFISDWSEVKDAAIWLEDNRIQTLNSVENLLPSTGVSSKKKSV